MFLWREEWVGVLGGATFRLAFADTDAQVIHEISRHLGSLYRRDGEQSGGGR